MTFPDACKILGLAPGSDPQPHLAEFRDARERIAAMVQAAPNEILAGRYQKGLTEFDEALAAVEAHLAQKSAAPFLPTPPKTTVLAVAAAGSTVEVQESPSEVKGTGRAFSYVACFLIVFLLAAGGGWFYVEQQRNSKDQLDQRIASLERQGSSLVENRRWQEAAAQFAEIEKLSPGSETAARGRLSIEAGMNDEQTQFIGYWTGQATAEMEAGRLTEAEAAVRQVLAKYPGEKESTALLGKIAEARVGASRSAAIAAARGALEQRDFSVAMDAAEKILREAPDDADANAILIEARAAREKAIADQVRAAELMKNALTRDTGQYDEEALEWIREAKSLDPGNAEVAALFEKLSSYTRTLHVPGDFANPQEALENARDRDRIVIGPGTWAGPLVIDAAVELQGAGASETRVECAPQDGSAITIGPDAKGARVSGISFRHHSFAAGADRFSVGLVRGGAATFSDCRFSDGSGHGLAIIEAGQGTVSRSRFEANGWNGAAVVGNGSTLEMRDSEALNNFEHGVESWDGAALILANSRCEGNSRNGVHADNGLSSATLEGNQLLANREFGLVVDSSGAGKITKNVVRGNLLGGVVMRATAARVTCTENQISGNQGPGLILEAGLPHAPYASNAVAGNAGQQILTGVDLSADAAEQDSPAATAPPSNIPRAKVVAEPR